MKNKAKNALLVIVLLLICTEPIKAQASHKSGFYPGIDSLYFTVNWNVGLNQQILVSVNKFTDYDYQPYIDGIWLKKISQPNTWEDNIYARNPCNYPFNDTLKGGDRNKVNVIRVLLIDTMTQSVVRDSVYIIGVNQTAPKFHSFFITVDSLDFAEMMERYDEDIRLRAWVTTFSPVGKLESSQPVEFYIAAGSSACIANKGFAIKGEDKFPILGPKNIKTSVFSGSSTIQNVKKIKLRSGNGGQLSSFGAHEIVEKILDYPALMLGGVRVNLGVIYINGSYWSLTFPQEKSDDERVIAAKWNVDKDSVDVIVPIPFNVFIDSMYSGTKTVTFQVDSITSRDTTFLGTYVKIDFTYDSLSTTFYNQLGFDSLQFFPESAFGIDQFCIVTNPDGQKNLVATAEEGTAHKFRLKAQRINEMIFDTVTNHYNELSTLIDMDMWLRYVVVINYFHMFDVISNNVAIAVSHKNLPTLIGTDWDGASVWGQDGNNWNTKIFYDANTGQYDQGFLFKVIRLILRSPQAQERLVLLYQDMLNTVLKPDRTTKILDTMRSKIMLEYPYHHQAWGGSPNGGQDSIGQENVFTGIQYFLINRNDIALQYLTNQFQSQDSLLVPNDAHPVNIIFDSIPANITEVVINYDTLLHFKNNWSGVFLKKPSVTIDARKIGNNSDYGRLYFKEYPDSGLHFIIAPDSVENLTLMLRPIIILPVELVSFTCSPEGNGTRLSWQTASEFNNSHFVIESSQDAIAFDSVGLVVGSGTSNVLHNYSFLDDGRGYYRLKQVDNNGQTKMTGIIDCRGTLTDTPQNQIESVLIFPNPTSGMITVKNVIGTVDVVDVLGKVLFTQEINQLDNVLSLQHVPAGTYIIKVLKPNGDYIVQKVFKL